MTWTRFMDMHSGGGGKEPQAFIYIEAGEEEARSVFFARFGHSPDRVSCTCCGEDYSVASGDSLEQLTGYDRNCAVLETPRGPETRRYVTPGDPWFEAHYYLEAGEEAEAERRGYRVRPGRGRYLTLGEYLTSPEVLVVRAGEITDGERRVEVPRQGYVWVGE